jgi:hypothetical protein
MSRVEHMDWLKLATRFVGIRGPVEPIGGYQTFSVRYRPRGLNPGVPRFWHVVDGRIVAINEEAPLEGAPVFDGWKGASA